MGRKRFLALVMALSMLFTLMAPALTFATGTGSEEETPGAGTSEVTEETNEQGSDTDPDEGDGAGNDAGDTNTGADNTGDTGTGDAGADNTGDTGTGDSDTGDVDTGDVDTGDTDTGDTDTGADNTGDTGDADTGDTGTGDTGTGDTGTGDTGTGNAGTGDTGTGNAGTGDTGTSDTGTGDTGTDETLPPATVPGDGDGDGDGEGDGDGDLGEEEVEKTRGTTEPTTITVAVISFLNEQLGTTGWEVHYWGDGIDGYTSCSLKTPQTIVKHSLGSAYWQGTDKEFLVYSATIPAGATNYNVSNGGEWFGENGNLADQKGVYIFENSGNKAEFVESIPFTLGTITVYYRTTWDQPRVHYWFTDGGKVDFGGTNWPGVAMDPVQNQENKFKATIPANVGGLLFNNGSEETVNIRNGIENGAYWRPNGQDGNGLLRVEPAVVTVIFNLNGGNIGGDTNNVEVTVQDGDSVAAQAPSPTKESYRFVGWLLEQNSDLFDLGLALYGDTNNAITLYAQYKQLYTVTPGGVEHGTVTADKAQAVEGETVTLTVTPDTGYQVSEMKVNGEAIEPANGVYSFIMPASDVTVTATFVSSAPALPTAEVQTVSVSAVAALLNITEAEANAALANLNVNRPISLSDDNKIGTVAADSSIFIFRDTTTDEATIAAYADWDCDYVISFDKAVKVDSIVLTGYYMTHGAPCSFTLPHSLNAGGTITMLKDCLNWPFTYSMIHNNVGTFLCTVTNLSTANVGTKMTVSLVLTNGSDSITIGDPIEYTLKAAKPLVRNEQNWNYDADSGSFINSNPDENCAEALAGTSPVTLSVNGGTSKVTFDAEAASYLSNKGAVTLSISRTDNGADADRAVFRIELKQENNTPVFVEGDAAGTATVTVPFAGADENTKVYLVTADGKTLIDGVTHVAGTSVTFPVSHFSEYEVLRETPTPTYVAQIGDTGYETLEAANAAAVAGDVITLLTDVTLTDKITLKGDVTLDGDGHTITSTGKFITGTAYKKATFKNLTFNKTVASDYCFLAADHQTVEFENVTVNFPNKGGAIQIGYMAEVTFKGQISIELRGTPNDSSPIAAILVNGDQAKLVFGTDASLTITDNRSNPQRALICTGNHDLVIEGTPNVNGTLVKLVPAEGETNHKGYDLESSAYLTEWFVAKVVFADKLDEYHATFAAAADAADGEVITLLANISDPYVLDDNETLKIKHDGFTLSVKDNYGNDAVAKTEGDVTTYTLDAEASIGTTLYATLAEAIAAAQDGDEIVLLKDVEASAVVAITKSITLNGNGKTLNTTATRAIRIDASNVDVTIKDLTVNGTYERAFQVNPDLANVKLTLDNCTATATMYTVNICSGVSDLELTIDNCNLTGWGVINLWGNNDVVNISNSNLIGINDKGYNADGWNDFGVIVLEGDTTGQTTEHSRAYKVTVTNSTIEAKATTGNKQSSLTYNKPSVSNEVVFDGCTIKLEGQTCSFLTNNNNIDGSTTKLRNTNDAVTNEKPTLPEGYAYKQDGSYYVVTKAVAKVEDTYFATFAEAAAAANGEKPVVLLADVEEAYELEGGKTLTVDANGNENNLTVTVPEGYVLKSETAEGVTTYTAAQAVAKIGDVLYDTLAGAIEAVQSNETIVILKDLDCTGMTLTLPTGVTGVTIKGEDPDDYITLTDLTGMAKTNSDLTFENIKFLQNSKTLTMRGSNIAFDHCTFTTETKAADPITSIKDANDFAFSYCDFIGKDRYHYLVGDNSSCTNISIDYCNFVDGWSGIYYGNLKGEVRITNSIFNVKVYTNHTGTGGALGSTSLYCENNEYWGWTSYGQEVSPATFKNCIFHYQESGYNYVKPSAPKTTFEGCVFEEGVKVETQSGITNTFKECYMLVDGQQVLVTAANISSLNSDDTAGDVIVPVAAVEGIYFYSNYKEPDMTEAVDAAYAASEFAAGTYTFYCDPNPVLSTLEAYAGKYAAYQDETTKTWIVYKLVTGVNVAPEELVFVKGDTETKTLTATIVPDEALNKEIVWTSSDETVATVDENGVVTPVGQGTATITAAMKAQSDIKAEATVVVAVAKITDGENNVTFYATLQAAVDAARELGGTQTIQIISDITTAENVTIYEDEGFKLTIDGTKDGSSKYNVDAKITVDGKRVNGGGHGSTSNGASVTIQNIAFTNATKHDFVYTNGYAHHVTIDNCSFTGTSDSWAFNTQTTNDANYGITIRNCTFENVRMIQGGFDNAPEGFAFKAENLIGTNVKVGLNVKTGGVSTIENVKITTEKYAFRDFADGYVGTFTLKGNNEFISTGTGDDSVISVRGGAADSAPHILIESGKYSGNLYFKNSTGNGAGSMKILSITGGIFTVPPMYDCCGYDANNNHLYAIENTDEATKADYPYTVGIDAVAKVKDVGYFSVANAAAARHGDVNEVITLLKSANYDFVAGDVLKIYKANDQIVFTYAVEDGFVLTISEPVDGVVTYTAVGAVAKIEREDKTLYFATIQEAVMAANENEVIEVIAAGDYTLPGLPKKVTLKGAVDGVVFNHTTKGNIAAIPNGATFENVAFNFGNVNYHGFQHAGTINMIGCTLNGKFFSYGDMNFSNCVFNQTNSDYHMWCYSGNITYEGCTFTNEVTGKFLNIYNESGSTKYTVTVNDCTFINNGSLNKAALNVKETCGSTILNYNVVISNSTAEGNFPVASESEGLIVGGDLWQVDDRLTNGAEPGITVYLDDVLVYPVYKASVSDGTNETKYTNLKNAVAAVQNDETIKLLADIDLASDPLTSGGYAVVSPENMTVTLDLNGKALTGGALDVYGTLTITDTSEGASGSITGTKHGIWVNPNASLTVNAGTIKSGTGYAVRSDAGTVVIDGGKIQNSAEGAGAIYVTDTTLTMTGGTVESTKDDTDAICLGGASVANISGGTVTGHDWGVTLFGTSKLTVSDNATIGTSAEEGYAISTNGNAGENATVIVTGGTITGAELGIYLPSGTATISGGDITGATAVYQKSGSLTISGGTIAANGQAVGYDHNGNGGNATGDALVVESCDYPNGDPVTEITGGTFTSENGLQVGYYEKEEREEPAEVTSKNNRLTIPDGYGWKDNNDGTYTLSKLYKLTIVYGGDTENPVKINGVVVTEDGVEMLFAGDALEKVLPDELTRSNYTSYEWKVPGQNGTFEDAPETMPASDLTVYAIWQGDEKVIIFSDYDTTRLWSTKKHYGDPMPVPTYTYDEQTRVHTITFPGDIVVNLTREGYTLVEAKLWGLAVPGQGNYEFVRNDTGFMLNWVKVHTVTFDPDPDVDGDETKVKVIDGDKVSEPEKPTKEGYTFKGWYNVNNEYVFSKPVVEDLTLTAKWEINKYSVIFNAAGGSPVPEAQTVDYNEKATKPAEDPTKANAVFVGWFADGATEAFDFTTVITEDTTLTAQWTAAIASVTHGEAITYYASLQAAVDAAEAGDTVTLLVDLKEEKALTQRVDVDATGKSITIDLNGKTIARLLAGPRLSKSVLTTASAW